MPPLPPSGAATMPSEVVPTQDTLPINLQQQEAVDAEQDLNAWGAKKELDAEGERLRTVEEMLTAQEAALDIREGVSLFKVKNKNKSMG